MNYILFDQDFNYVDAGFTQVSNTANTHQQLTLNKTIDEKGYLYVYLSNESASNHNVYFDDLRIVHEKGTILQEDHYYPFGANISALSSTAPLSKPNGYKFNGIEFTSDFDINTYDALYRGYDASLGRWMQVDPEVEQFYDLSPYNFGFNDPISWADPFGNCPDCPEDAKEGDTASPNGVEYKFENGEWVRQGGDAGEAVVTPTSSGEAQAASTAAQARLGDWLASDLSNLAWAFKNYPEPHQQAFIQDRFLEGRSRAFWNNDVTQAAVTVTTSFIPVGAVLKYGGRAAKFFIKPLSKSITTADGFLLKGITIKAPVNIPVQRFGNMSLTRPDFWGARIGTSSFGNRTFAAIKPGWNSLTQFSTGVIPKGTSIKFGIVGPQGLKYPGGSVQFIVNSKEVIKQSSKAIKR